MSHISYLRLENKIGKASKRETKQRRKYRKGRKKQKRRIGRGVEKEKGHV